MCNTLNTYQYAVCQMSIVLFCQSSISATILVNMVNYQRIHVRADPLTTTHTHTLHFEYSCSNQETLQRRVAQSVIQQCCLLLNYNKQFPSTQRIICFGGLTRSSLLKFYYLHLYHLHNTYIQILLYLHNYLVNIVKQHFYNFCCCFQQ